MPEIIVVAHNIRSTHNIGAIFRTSEGFGVAKIILSGYSPYPETAHDTRLPHIRTKITSQIHKSALGAETMVAFEHTEQPPLRELKADGYTIIGLEQATHSVPLMDYQAPDKCAVLIGEEVDGIAQELIDLCDTIVEIPMRGQKESFNVSVATGIALYQLACLN